MYTNKQLMYQTATTMFLNTLILISIFQGIRCNLPFDNSSHLPNPLQSQNNVLPASLATKITDNSADFLNKASSISEAPNKSKINPATATANLNNPILPTNASQSHPNSRKIRHITSRGYPDTNPVNFRNYSIIYHIVPHIHGDPGWIIPIDSDFNGTQNTRGDSCVSCELNTIFDLLRTKQHRVFSYAEMAFFEMWYNALQPQLKRQVKELVANGQLYFPNAGYVMNDEACTYYEDIIDQFILGHRFVHKEFNYTPSVGSSIDPFEHSSTQAYLIAQMGMSMTSIERIQSKDIQDRKSLNRTTFLWVPDENFPEWNLIGHLDFVKYGDTPDKFISFPQDPSQKSSDLNRTQAWLDSQVTKYSNNHMYFQIGDELNYNLNESSRLYEAIEKLVDDLNGNEANSNKKAILSSPDLYASLWYDHYNQTPGIRLSTKHDDFFPYADNSTGEAVYWTGFYTSRAMLKGQIKYHAWFLQTAKKYLAGLLLSIAESPAKQRLVEQVDTAVNQLERAVAFCQRLDGIAGTSTKFTNVDCLQRLKKGHAEVWSVMASLMTYEDKRIFKDPSMLTTKPFLVEKMTTSAGLADLTHTLSAESDFGHMLLRVYNPGHSRKTVHRVKIPHGLIRVYNSSRNLADYDVICSQDYLTNSSKEDCDLYISDYFPAYATRFYLIEYSVERGSEVAVSAQEGQTTNITLPFDSSIKIHPDNKTFSYKFCSGDEDCVSETLTLDYKYYENYSERDRAGDAGIDAMKLQLQERRSLANATECKIYQGKYVTVIQVVYLKNGPEDQAQAVMTLRIQNHDVKRGIEIESFISSLFNVDHPKVTEVILLVQSHTIDNAGVFKTDSNGLKMRERSLNRKADFPMDRSEDQIEANYYPVTAGITISDKNKKRYMGIINDRPQGGSSARNGEIELTITGRVPSNYGKGNEEPLNDEFNETTRSRPEKLKCTHYYVFSEKSETELQRMFRKAQLERDTQFLAIYQEITTKNTSIFIETEPKVMEDALPPFVEASIRQYAGSDLFIRLVNLHDTETAVNISLVDSQGSIPLLAHISGVKARVSASKIEEVSLNTIMSKEAAIKRKYQIREVGKIDIDSLLIKNLSNFTMRPLELLTFRISGFTIDNSNKAQLEVQQAGHQEFGGAAISMHFSEIERGGILTPFESEPTTIRRSIHANGTKKMGNLSAQDSNKKTPKETELPSTSRSTTDIPNKTQESNQKRTSTNYMARKEGIDSSGLSPRNNTSNNSTNKRIGLETKRNRRTAGSLITILIPLSVIAALICILHCLKKRRNLRIEIHEGVNHAEDTSTPDSESEEISPHIEISPVNYDMQAVKDESL